MDLSYEWIEHDHTLKLGSPQNHHAPAYSLNWLTASNKLFTLNCGSMWDKPPLPYIIKMHTFRQITDNKGGLDGVWETKAHLQVLWILAVDVKIWMYYKSVLHICCRYESMSVDLLIMRLSAYPWQPSSLVPWHKYLNALQCPLHNLLALVLICVIVKFSAIILWMISF